METVHGTCIAYDGHGIVLRGPPGAGKSDLALRAIADGASLVADDRVALALRDDVVIATAPPALAGLIEVRGVGIVRMDRDLEAPVRLVIDLCEAGAVERLPDRRLCELLGRAIPALSLAPFEASAAVKLRLALSVALDPAMASS